MIMAQKIRNKIAFTALQNDSNVQERDATKA